VPNHPDLLGDLNVDAFLPFKTGNNITLWSEKHLLDQYNFYLQDEWKYRSHLTFNYGLRTEINPAPSTPGRVYVPTSPIVGPGGLVTFAKGEKWFDRNNITFGPRLAVAWTPEWKTGFLNGLFGDPGKSVVRLGYGLAFDPINTFVVTAGGFMTAAQIDASAARTEINANALGAFVRTGLRSRLANPLTHRAGCRSLDG
jgi:hypothetical protein